MTRVAKVPLDQWDPELRAMVRADDKTELERGILRMLAHKPAVAKAFVALQAAMADSTELDARLRELVRLRIAFHNQCCSCMAIRYPAAIDAGLDEAAVCALERPQDADNLTPAEKSAIAFADRFATDHWSIDEADYDRLRSHFTEAAIVELGLVCAMCVGIGRLAMSWNMVEELPDAFVGEGRAVAPWHGDPVIVFRR